MGEDLTLSESVQALTGAWQNIDMAEVLRNALKPRVRYDLDPRVMARYVEEQTGIPARPVTPEEMIERLIADPRPKLARRARLWELPRDEPLPLALVKTIQLGP